MVVVVKMDAPALEGRELEREFVARFIRPDRRERWSEGLPRPKSRAKLLDRLDHSFHEDVQGDRVVEIAARDQTVEGVKAALRARGAPGTCWCVSSHPKMDAVMKDLGEAIECVLGSGFGTVLICSARLAYFEGEEMADRWILADRGL